ncbi:MAG: glycosyltransferase [Endomicrobium sp.]|jgi:glycosyltransferase involved in cell wall biosynthesis|nr:glycosyltransferase [Endomicrobium sp.]
MTSAPKVSVIIPVYNTEKYLRQCLDSVVNQTLKDIEIICINDGSTDNSLQILNEYANKDNRIVVINSTNEGAEASRNKGLVISNGKYLMFWDSDDFFELDALEEFYDTAEENQCDIVLSFYKKYCDITGNINLIKLGSFPDKKIFYKEDSPRLIRIFTPNVWSKFFKRNFIIENNLKFQKITRTNDLFFVYSAIAISTKTVILEKYLITYRINNMASLQNNNHNSCLDFIKALDSLRNFLLMKGIYQQHKESFINKFCEISMYNLKTLKSHKLACINVLTNLYILLTKYEAFNLPKEYFYKDVYYDFVKRVKRFKLLPVFLRHYLGFQK